jgi:rhodanese-related sulfurtransferase
MKRALLAAILVVASSPAWAQQHEPSFKNITPAEVEEMLQQDTTVVLLDVRTHEEFESETGHLQKAILIPVANLEERLRELDKYKESRIIAYCRSGYRSYVAAGLLTAMGFRAANMIGGILRWNAEGRPVERGQSKAKR